MKRPTVIGALIAAVFVFAPGIASSQDDYTLQVEVTNKSKRPVFLGTGYSKTYKEIKLGGSEIYELTLTSSQCKKFERNRTQHSKHEVSARLQ